jgi:2-amino-4-hydroxy-6-hydroxymethyldihydropteridine diphosphokinase
MNDVVCYIALGSNLGDPAEQLRSAVEALRGVSSSNELLRSGLYRSEPVGPAGQPDYLNAVVSFPVRLAPAELLRRLQEIEAAHGRTRELRWGARTLDLDILLYGDSIIRTDQLQVPHPLMVERLFVLKPLMDLSPRLLVPGLGVVGELMEQCPGLRLEPVSWPRRRVTVS